MQSRLIICMYKIKIGLLSVGKHSRANVHKMLKFRWRIQSEIVHLRTKTSCCVVKIFPYFHVCHFPAYGENMWFARLTTNQHNIDNNIITYTCARKVVELMTPLANKSRYVLNEMTLMLRRQSHETFSSFPYEYRSTLVIPPYRESDRLSSCLIGSGMKFGWAAPKPERYNA